MRSPINIVDVDRTETWSHYKAGMCDTCMANCCTMPLEIKLPDLVRLELVDPFEAEHEDPRQIAKRLVKAGVIERFHQKSGIFTVMRRADGHLHRPRHHGAHAHAAMRAHHRGLGRGARRAAGRRVRRA